MILIYFRVIVFANPFAGNISLSGFVSGLAFFLQDQHKELLDFMKRLATIFLLLTVFLLGAGESYSFHLLSDLHLGAADTYHPTRFKGNIHRAERLMPVFSQMFSDMMKTTPDAKFVIQDGLVKVNGEVDTRRGKKLVPGDVVEYRNMSVKVE